MKGFDERVWYRLFRCPKCGYETTVTNVCRQCHKMPLIEECWCPVWCSWHEVAHRVNGKWVAHRSIMMEETGWACRFNPIIEKEEYKLIGFLPEGAILK